MNRPLTGLHLPSIRGRAWADRGPLLLAGFVIALATLLASAIPQVMGQTADDAVDAAVTRAGARGAVVVDAPFEPEDDLTGSRRRPAHTAEIVDDAAKRAQESLGPGLRAAMRPPVGSVTSENLTVSGHGPGRIIQLVYISGADPAGVTWTAGAAPKSTVPAAEATTAVRKDGELWPVQVGLSEETAAELGAEVGDRIQAQDIAHQDVEIRVSGVFRALAPDDLTWQTAPEVLRPVIGADGTGTRIELAALLSADSLADGRLALDDNAMTRSITFTPASRMVRWDNAEALAGVVVALKTASGSVSRTDMAFKWESGLDVVLQEARTQVLAASAQAAVLLVGLVATAALVLLLAADLLVRRRELVLAGVRRRGASLAGIGAELAIESSAVALAGTAVGLLLARRLAGGYSLLWLIPVVLVAVLGGPVLGTRAAASATRGRQAPANRSARRSALRTGQMRRVALEAAVLLAAVGAFVALRQRGVVSAGTDGGASILPAVAPTLGAVTGALVLLRLLPLGTRLALAQAARSRRSLPLFAAARAAATAARPLPFVVLIMSSALLTFALAVSSTETDGQADGAWRTVGADAQLGVTGSASVNLLAQRLSAADGVRHAVAAQVTDNTMVIFDDAIGYLRLVVVDATEFQRLLADTPLPDAPALARLKSTGGRVPALLRSPDGEQQQTKRLTLSWDETKIELQPVGIAPAVGEGEGAVLVVDAAALETAGAEAAPNTVWVVGPQAGAAASAVAESGDAVLLRQDVWQARRSAPLAAGLLRLATASTGVLLLLGLLSVALGAAASAPGRGETLARLRTLGLRPRESRQVAAGELLPPVLVGAVGGLLLGVALAHASLGLLTLRLLTGQATDPALVVPWQSVVPVVLFVAAVAIVVEVEASRRRRERLGQILRAGNG